MFAPGCTAVKPPSGLAAMDYLNIVYRLIDNQSAYYIPPFLLASNIIVAVLYLDERLER